MKQRKQYTASKKQEKTGQRYSVIYRHPGRIDPSTGKPGRRVRRSLGTSDETEANQLIDELNSILGNDAYWSFSACATASDRFDSRVVSIFYDGMEPNNMPSSTVVRDKYIPLPTADSGYKKILLLGTTGAGKTTVIRQILGIDPKLERFPATSTAKTTIADTEIIIKESTIYRAVVTFSRRDEVIDHLTDCASKAAILSRNADSDRVRRTLLDHENQRFRFSYVLGRPTESASATSDLADFDELDEDNKKVDVFTAQPDVLPGIDLNETEKLIERSVDDLKKLVAEIGTNIEKDFDQNEKNNPAFQKELEEEELDRQLRSDERFNALVDTLLDEIEKRFDALTDGKIVRDQQSWPQAWIFESEDRAKFLKAVNRFSSNYAPLFGHLLSPLVDGVRVEGKFHPKWWGGETPRFILIDGEGLGHTPKSAAALPTVVAKAIDEVDGVLLVDNATQPVQAAPAMAIQSILTAGNIEKLIFCFTHFDEVQGDNLYNTEDRARHVLASVENLLSTFREEYHSDAEHAVRRRLTNARFFLANIHKQLDPEKNRATISQLRKLVQALEKIGEHPDPGSTRPIYDKTNLVLSITNAIRSFHRQWNARLGRTSEKDVGKEHWTRIKALNRRFAEATADQYDTLRPAADLRELLKNEIYRTLEAPCAWTDGLPDNDVKKARIIDEFSNKVAGRLLKLIDERLSKEPFKEWQGAYALRGPGSTFERASKISSGIFSYWVPVPDVTPSPDKNEFLHKIISEIQSAAEEYGVKLY